MFRRASRALLALVLWSALSAIASLASIVHHLDLPRSRQLVGDVLSALATRELAGSLTIGRVVELTPEHVLLEDVVLEDADGVEVIRLDVVEGWPDLRRLLRGEIVFARVAGRNGRLVLRTDPRSEDRLPSFLGALEPVDPGTPGGPPGPRVLLERMSLSRVRVVGELLGRDGLDAPDVRLEGRLEIDDGVELRVWDAAGALVAPYPFVARLEHLEGTIDSRDAQGISLYAHVRSVREETPGLHDDVRVRMELFRPLEAPEGSPQVLSLRAAVDPLLARTVAEVGVELAEPLDGPVWGVLELEGPLDRLELDVRAITEGGRLVVSGTLDGRRGSDLVVRTEGLELSGIVRDAPVLEVAGDVTVRLRPGPEGDDDTVALEVDLAPFSFEGWAVPPVRAVGRVEDGGRVVVERFEAPHGGGRLTGRGVIDGQVVELELRAAFPELARAPNLDRLAPAARGALAADVDLRVADGRVRARGEVVLNDFRYPPVRVERLVVRGEVSGELDQPRLDLRATAEGTTVAGYPLGDGTLALEGGPRAYAGRGAFAAADGRRFAFAGTASTAAGRLAVDAPELVLEAGPHRYAGTLEGLVVRGGDVELGRLVLSSDTQRLTLGGLVRAAGPDALAANAQDVSLEGVLAFLPGVALDGSGRLDVDLDVQGDLGSPRVVLEGGVRDGRLGSLTGVDLAYVLRYGGGEGSLEVLAQLGSEGLIGVRGTGLVDTTADDLAATLLGGVYDTTIEVVEVELGRLRPLVGPDAPAVGGRISGRVTLEGSPYAPNASGTLNVPSLRWPGAPSLAVSTDFAYQTGALVGTVVVSDEAARAPPLATAHGSLLIDLATLLNDPETAIESLGTLPWRLELRVPTRRLDALPPEWASAVPADAGAVRLLAEATLGGGSAPTQGDLRVVLDWDPEDERLLPCRGLEAPRVELGAALRDGITRVDVQGLLGDRSVLQAEAVSDTPFDAWVAGEQPWGRPVTRLSATVTAMPVDAVPRLCTRAEGTFDGTLVVESLFGARPTARARLATQDLRFAGGELLRASAEAVIGADETLRATLRMRWPGNERAQVVARVPVRWPSRAPLPGLEDDAELDARASFRAAPLAPLALLVDEIDDLRGFVSGDLTVRGPVGSFDVLGTLEVSEGGVHVVPLGQQLRDVRGQLEFRGDWVRVVGVRARDGDGDVRVDGSLTFDGLDPERADVSLNARAFPVRQEGSVLARVSTSARLRGTFGEDAAAIDLDLGDMDVRLPEQSSLSVQALDAHPDVDVVGERAPGDEAPRGAPYPFVFRVTTPSTAWVRRNDFSAEIRAQLVATFVEDSLRLAGTVEIRRGLFEVFGKRFEVVRGGLSFSGDDKLDPGVSLVATHALQGGDDVVTVIAGGTLRAPTVDFTSTHPTCQADEQVIALLVSGACSVADTFAATGESADAERQALSFLAGITAGILTVGARQQFGDVVPVLVIESGDSAFQSARVRAGFRADSLIPDELRSVIRGIYVEGQVTAEGGQDAVQQQGGGPISGGFLFELRFPYDLYGRTEFETPSNAWSVDLTWEP